MEENAKLIESLLEKAADYGKTSFELTKLKTIDKTSDVVSSIIPHSIVFLIFASFLIFLNLGLAFWLGELLGRTFYGFFVIAAFYVLLGLIIHFLMHKWLKRIICNYIINQFLN